MVLQRGPAPGQASHAQGGCECPGCSRSDRSRQPPARRSSPRSPPRRRPPRCRRLRGRPGREHHRGTPGTPTPPGASSVYRRGHGRARLLEEPQADVHPGVDHQDLPGQRGAREATGRTTASGRRCTASGSVSNGRLRGTLSLVGVGGLQLRPARPQGRQAGPTRDGGADHNEANSLGFVKSVFGGPAEGAQRARARRARLRHHGGWATWSSTTASSRPTGLARRGDRSDLGQREPHRHHRSADGARQEGRLHVASQDGGLPGGVSAMRTVARRHNIQVNQPRARRRARDRHDRGRVRVHGCAPS